MIIRHLTPVPGSNEWQPDTAVREGPYPGATVETYLEVCEDAGAFGHIVADLDDDQRADLGIEDLRGRIRREIGTLVAFPMPAGPCVSYELVELEEDEGEGEEPADEPDESMDGDAESALASVYGADEDW